MPAHKTSPLVPIALFVLLLALAAVPIALPEFIPFGKGTEGSLSPGQTPFLPELSGYGDPAPGATVNLYLMNCLGDQPGVLLFGYERKDIAYFGGTIYPSLDVTRVIYVTGLAGSPPIGYWSWTGLTLPPNPSLSGRSFYIQAATRDPGNPYRVTLSTGL